MPRTVILVPAYGKDYKSAKEAKTAFEADRDFLIQDISCPEDGRYAARRNLKSDYDEVKIRYNRLMDFTFVRMED